MGLLPEINLDGWIDFVVQNYSTGT